MIIAVDFDGTISRGKFPAIDGEQPYAGESLRKLHDEGHKIIIWTCRTGDQLLNAINWLLERKIPFDRVNDHDPENIAKYEKAGKRYMPIAISMTKTSEVFPDGWHVWRRLNGWKKPIKLF